MVAISSTSREDCARRRMMVNSTALPTRKPPAIAAAKASHQANPCPVSNSTKEAAQSAPTSAWAKFRIPLAR